MNPTFLRESPDGVYLAIKLQPRASRQQISGQQGDELKVSVTAPPVDAAANRALIEFIAELLDVPRGQVALVKGQTSRHKTLFLKGTTRAATLQKLAPHLA